MVTPLLQGACANRWLGISTEAIRASAATASFLFISFSLNIVIDKCSRNDRRFAVKQASARQTQPRSRIVYEARTYEMRRALNKEPCAAAHGGVGLQNSCGHETA